MSQSTWSLLKSQIIIKGIGCFKILKGIRLAVVVAREIIFGSQLWLDKGGLATFSEAAAEAVAERNKYAGESRQENQFGKERYE
jgi:hypothetical protein